MTALITGGTSGIGKELAIALSDLGYDLFLVSRKENGLDEIKKRCKEGTKIEYHSYDLSKEEECFRLLEDTKDRDDITVFVNNAGFGDIGRMEDTSLEKEVNMVKLNDIASLILIKSYLLRFEKKGSGHVLAVASAAAFGVAGYMNVYYASKSFVYSLCHGYYRELRDKKSKVVLSCLLPGPVRTGFEERANAKFSFHTYPADKLATYAVKKMLGGHFEIVYGTKMKLAHVFSHVVPRIWMSKFLDKQAEIRH